MRRLATAQQVLLPPRLLPRERSTQAALMIWRLWTISAFLRSKESMCGSGVPVLVIMSDRRIGIEGLLRQHEVHNQLSGREAEILHGSVELEFDVWDQK